MVSEDKHKICDYLYNALKETKQYREIRDIEYDKIKELVYISYPANLRKIVDVFNCTGAEMVRKILQEI